MPSSSPLSQKKYTKLGGRSRGHGFAGRLQIVRLWKTDDHLLLQEYGYIMDVYKRFAFSDLKAIHIQRTWRREITCGILAAIGVLFGGSFAAGIIAAKPEADQALALGITGGVVAGIFLLIAAILYALGPTCACFFETAVQRQRIPSLNSLRKVRKVLPVIREAVLQAQQPSGTPDQAAQAASFASGAAL